MPPALKDAFVRAAAKTLYWACRLAPTDPECIVPLAEVKKYLKLDSPSFNERAYYPIRIDYALRVNLTDFRRATWTKGFESRPTDQKRIKVPIENFVPEEGGMDHYIQIFHTSQAIVFTDYMRPSTNRGFAVMIYPRSSDPREDLYIAFGMYGHYDRKGNLFVRKIIMPGRDKFQCLTDPRLVNVTPEMLPVALVYARLCAEQIYARETLTPRQNLMDAAKEIGQDYTLPWNRQPAPEPMQLRA